MREKRISVMVLSIMTLLFIRSNLFAEEKNSSLDKSTIIEIWESNYYYNIKNAEIEYFEHIVKDHFADIDVTKIPAQANPENIVRNQFIRGVVDYFSPKYRWDITTSKTGFEDKNSILSYAFDAKNTTSYDPTENLGVICPGLVGRAVETTENIRPYMLLNTTKHKYYTDKYPNGVPDFSRLFGNHATLVSPKTEVISGESCHVLVNDVNVSGTQYQYKVWVAQDKGMLPMKYQEVVNNDLQEEIIIEKTESVETVTGVVWFPKVAYRTKRDKFLGLITYKLEVHKFLPNIKVNQDTFRVVFPNGTRVMDMVMGLDYIVGVGAIDEVTPVHVIDTDKKGQNKNTTETAHDNVSVYKDKTEPNIQDNRVTAPNIIANKENALTPVVANNSNSILTTKGFMILMALAAVIAVSFLFFYINKRCVKNNKE